MRVLDVMTPEPITVDVSTGVRRCAELLFINDIRHLPITRHGKLMGILADFQVTADVPEETTAGEIATPVQIIARPDHDLLHTLTRHAWSLQEAVVVVDEADQPIGIFTEHDAVRLAREVIDADKIVDDLSSTTVWAVDRHRPATVALDLMKERFIRHVVLLDQERAWAVVSYRDLMGPGLEDKTAGQAVNSRTLWKVTEDTSLKTAATIMADNGIGCLPIVDADDRPVGVVTRTDLIRSAMQSDAVLLA